MKPGVNLPKPLEDWNLANKFFIANISCADIKGRDLNTVVQDFNTIIYDYFKTHFGIVKTYNDQEFKEMYSNFTKRQLRNELKCFKKRKHRQKCYRIHVKIVTFKSSTKTEYKHRQHKPRRRSVKKLLVVL